MPKTRTPTVITHDAGLRFAIQVGDHQFMVDQPEHAGGENSAPSPIQLLGASLGSCVALYVHQFCGARGLPREGLRVEVMQHGATNPNRVARFELRVLLPEPLPPHYMEMLERVARSCPAWNTLAAGTPIDMAFEVQSAGVA